MLPKAALTLNLSFCGCGFLGIYHLGVATSLLKYGQPFLSNVQKYCGASAGALVACMLVAGQDKLQECVKFTFDLAKEIQRKPFGGFTPRYNLLRPLESFLELHLPHDAHVTASGKLHISLTNVQSRKNEIISEFQSRDELIKCLIATSYVPLYVGMKPVKIQGKKYMDGGVTNNLPILKDGQTICVSPFSGRQEICPNDKLGKGRFVKINKQDFQVNRNNIRRGYHAFFPPALSSMELYFKKGQMDAERYLKAEKWYQKEAWADPSAIVYYETSV